MTFFQLLDNELLILKDHEIPKGYLLRKVTTICPRA